MWGSEILFHIVNNLFLIRRAGQCYRGCLGSQAAHSHLKALTSAASCAQVASAVLLRGPGDRKGTSGCTILVFLDTRNSALEEHTYSWVRTHPTLRDCSVNLKNWVILVTCNCGLNILPLFFLSRWKTRRTATQWVPSTGCILTTRLLPTWARACPRSSLLRTAPLTRKPKRAVGSWLHSLDLRWRGYLLALGLWSSHTAYQLAAVGKAV